MNAITTPPAPTPREAARQRAIDRMARTCEQMISTGMQLVARAELLHRQRTRQTKKEHAK